MVEQRVQELCRDFAHYVRLYDERVPFQRAGQYEWHRRTIDHRLRMGSLSAAVRDEQFIASLWQTLAAWGMNSRRAKLVPLQQLQQGLIARLALLAPLESLKIDGDPPLGPQVAGQVWATIEAIPVTQGESKIVGGTKALHHLLPDLVPPMDRRYTQVFFHWDTPQFQARQRAVFTDMFGHVARLAQATHPSRFVGTGWRTSPAKILDNAVVAFCLEHGLADVNKRSGGA